MTTVKNGKNWIGCWYIFMLPSYWQKTLWRFGQNVWLSTLTYFTKDVNHNLAKPPLTFATLMAAPLDCGTSWRDHLPLFDHTPVDPVPIHQNRWMCTIVCINFKRCFFSRIWRKHKNIDLFISIWYICHSSVTTVFGQCCIALLTLNLFLLHIRAWTRH